MILQRLRRAAPTIIILGTTLFAALTVVAQVAKPQEYATVGEVHRFVVWAFLTGSIVVVGGLWVVYVRDQRSRSQQIDDLTRAVREHHENWTMHPAGSTTRIDAFDAKLNEVHVMLGGIQSATMALVEGQKRTVADLEDQEGRLRAVEGTLQVLHTEHQMMHGQAYARDPLASPSKRRSTDAQTGGENGSGEDYRIQRGRKS